MDLDCQDDDYACLRSYLESSFLQSTLDVRDFASYFEKYRDDTANYSLYIWGFVMPMIFYYESNGMIIPPEEPLSWYGWIDETSFDDNVYTLLGEPGVYPMFVKYSSL